MRDTVSYCALAAAARARDERDRSAMRRRAHERLEAIGQDVGDWGVLRLLSGDRGELAAQAVREEIESAAAWWRAQLAEQGHAPGQVAALVGEYRAAFMRGLRDRMGTAAAQPH